VLVVAPRAHIRAFLIGIDSGDEYTDKIHYVNRVYVFYFRCQILGRKPKLDILAVDFRLAVMKLSLRGEYALRALLVLGLHYDEEGVVRAQTISDEQRVPKRFLEQILNDLKSAGIIRTKRGVSGGYRLAKRPDQITVAAVVRHIEGALAPVSCVSENFYEKCTCPDEARCAIRSVMKEIRDSIVKIAEEVTIEELCQRSRRLQDEPLQPVDFVI